MLVPLVTAYRPCASCAKQNSTELCPHVVNMRPPSKDPRREALLSLLIFDSETFMAEMYGIPPRACARCFSDDDIAALRDSEPYLLHDSPRFIHVSIDPAEGGPDHFAIVASTCAQDGIWVVRCFLCVCFCVVACAAVCACGDVCCPWRVCVWRPRAAAPHFLTRPLPLLSSFHENAGARPVA